MKHLFTALGLILAFALPLSAETAPMSVDGATTITIDQAADLFDEGAFFVDVRKASDFDAGRVPGSMHLDVKLALNEAALAEEIGKHDKVVFYCNGVNCGRSAEACNMAVSWGFTQVYYMRDGFPEWNNAGLPVE